MKIGEKILSLRKQKGLSQEQLALELGVSRQAVSKWESEAAVPDLDKVLMLSSFFGVCTDYLLKEELEESPAAKSGEAGITAKENESGAAEDYISTYEFTDHSNNQGKLTLRPVSKEEALHFKESRNTASRRIAIGVVLCILAPIGLIVTDEVFQTTSKVENLAAIVLMLMIAIAVGLFVTSGIALSKFESLEKEPFILSDSILEELETEAEAFQKTFGIRMAMGVVLCILSTIPAIGSDGMGGKAEGIGTSLLFVLVAIGVYQFVRYGILYGTYTILLQKEEHTIKAKTSKKEHMIRQIMVIYWCVITAIYIAVSFLYNNWHISWIIWPCAGVLCAAFVVICKLVIKEER